MRDPRLGNGVRALGALLLVALLAGARPGAPRADAAVPTPLDVVTAAMTWTDAEGAEGLLALAATADPRGSAAGAVRIVHEATHATVSLLRGRVEEGDDGFEASFRGVGRLESEASPGLVEAPASLVVRAPGTFELTIGERILAGTKRAGDLAFSHAEGDTGTHADGGHEVGHWLGLFHGASLDEPPVLAFAVVAFDDPAEVTRTSQVLGLLRRAADGQSGTAHGHLDVLKQVGDPATGVPLALSSGFEAAGEAACVLSDGSEARTEWTLDLDLEGGLLELAAPGCGFAERLPIVRLPCPGDGRRTVVVGPDTTE